MMTQTCAFRENLSLLSAKAPEVAWKLEGDRPLANWEPFAAQEEVTFALGYAGGLVPPEEGRYLVLVDWNPAHIRTLVERCADLLRHPNVHVAFLDGDASFQYLQGYFSGLTAQVEIHPEYADDLFAKEARERLLNENQGAYRVIEELLHCPDLAASHILENLEALPDSCDAAHLFGAFAKVPAIICGAGPSLDRQVSAVNRLKDRALLFAPGSAFNALTAHGVRPHFGVGLDPYHAQYERLMMGSDYEVPFFYTGRWLPEARRCYSGPLLYVSGTDHPMARWIDGELGMGAQRVVEGSCGVHLSVELARLMGCDPIVFVGMDLAYTDGKLYGRGVGDMRALEDRLQSKHYLDGLVEQNGLITQWKWLEESRVLSDYAEKYPGTRFWNTSGGGLGLGKIARLALQDVEWGRAQPLEERVRSLTQEQIGPACGLENMFRESLARCIALLQKIPTLKGGKRALCEVELEGELAYQTYLDWPILAFKSRMERGSTVDERNALLLKLCQRMRG